MNSRDELFMFSPEGIFGVYLYKNPKITFSLVHKQFNHYFIWTRSAFISRRPTKLVCHTVDANIMTNKS